MTAEQYAIIKCISDHIWRRESLLNSKMDLNEVVALSQKHQIAGIIYYQNKKSKMAAQLNESYFATLYYSKLRERVLNQIDVVLTECGIDFVIIKGIEVAQYYPYPELRTMGDIDILVKGKDKKLAHDAFVKHGFTPTNITDCEWCYNKNNIQIELHDNLVYDRLISLEKHKVFFDNVWDHVYLKKGTMYKLEVEYHISYLIVHIRKHLLNSGVGLRQFVDLAMITHYGTIDWDIVRTYLEKLGLLHFGTICFSLCKQWFETETDLYCDISNEFFEAATQDIFSNGVFGFDNEVNKLNSITNQLRSGKTMFSIFLGKVFPRYEDICSSRNYSFINERPYLLPIAWFYRFYRIIKHRNLRSNINNTLKMFSKKTIVKDRKAMLENWGL